MIGLTVKTFATPERVTKAVDKAIFKSFQHAAASIAKDMKASFEKAPQGEASAPGEAPHTHRGVFFRRAVRFAADKDGAVIGPQASVIGEEVGQLHEFGGERGGAEFPERPFALPALERAIPRFAGDWKGAIGE